MSASIAESVPLRSLVVESQNGLSKRSGDSGDEVAVLRLADISEGQIDESDPRRIRLSLSEREKYTLRRGDLICIRVNGSRGLVGRVVPFTSPNAWAYCDHFIRLRPDSGRADHRYLAYHLNSSPVRRKLELSMVSSAGQHTVSQGTMLDLPVPLPAIQRQRQIVAEIEKQFSRLDEAVANLRRVKANLRRHERSVLDAAFAGELVVPEAEMARKQGRPFESGAQLLARIGLPRQASRAKGSSRSLELDLTTLPALPPGWDWAPLSTITSIKGGITVDSKRLDAAARPVPYLRVANVQRGRLDLSEMKVIEAPESDIEALRLLPGDVLNRTGFRGGRLA